MCGDVGTFKQIKKLDTPISLVEVDLKRVTGGPPLDGARVIQDVD